MTALGVLHADDHLLALDKPAGLLCVPGRGPDKQDCLTSQAAARWPGVRVVHRLDMATSGIVVFARTPAAQKSLGLAFATQRVRKTYEALVRDCGDKCRSALDWQLIDLPIAADWPRRPLRIIDPAGKPSRTRWRLSDAPGPSAHIARLQLQPLTGRTHQLRVHLQAIGLPILGDPLYGPQTEDPTEGQANAGRLMLHACRLVLEHPSSGELVDIVSPCPF